jgi:hypothetical protein
MGWQVRAYESCVLILRMKIFVSEDLLHSHYKSVITYLLHLHCMQ